jgi:hypothetical protein
MEGLHYECERVCGGSMKLRFALVLMLLAIAAPAWSQKIKVVYDKQLNFSQFKTFAWEPHGAVAHPMLAANVVGAIEDELKARGLQRVGIDQNPGLVIQVYGSVDQEVSFNSTDPFYAATGGIPPFDPSFSGPMLSGQFGATSVTIHKGQLVVDLLDAANKKLIWRGMSQQNLAAHDPNKLLSQVNGAISKMFKQYPVKSQG